MELIDILPIVMPGILIQLFIQAFYIKHCWENPTLTQRQKAYFIIAIAIFNIMAAAVYLFMSGKKNESDYKKYKGVEMDSHIRQGIFVSLLSAFEIFTLGIISENLNNDRYPYIIGLLSVCFIIMIINGLIIKRKHGFIYFLLPALQLLLIIPVEYLIDSRGAPLTILVVVAVIINGFPLQYAKKYSIAAFILYIMVIFAKANRVFDKIDADEVISYIYINLLVFMLVFATFYTMKKQFTANKMLEEAFNKLKKQSLQLEEMGAIEERNRITGEIHDTVGHTLTSALILIEASVTLMNENKNSAGEKLLLAKQQVKKGLDDIRNSVRTIQAGGEKEFLSELKSLLSEIRTNTNLIITDITELKSELLPIQQTVLLRSIKECATNSLKHGKSTEVDLLIQEYKGTVRLTFSDNGEGAEDVIYGFGLSGMKNRVQSIGGTMTVNTTKGEGFTVAITIPVGIQKEGVNV